MKNKFIMNSKVDDFILKASKWQEEISFLRDILLECNLQEDFKWKQPCYSFEGNNIVIIATLKDYCGLGFFKGALLKNTHGLLTAPGANSQAVRQLKFSSVEDIAKHVKMIKSTIKEAIKIEKSGQKIEFKEKDALVFPEELETMFKADKAFAKAFYALTPGRKRGYNLYFTAAKQSATRTSRIKDCKNKILAGKGKDECSCGLSKFMPRCDGSHKMIKQ